MSVGALDLTLERLASGAPTPTLLDVGDGWTPSQEQSTREAREALRGVLDDLEAADLLLSVEGAAAVRRANAAQALRRLENMERRLGALRQRVKALRGR